MLTAFLSLLAQSSGSSAGRPPDFEVPLDCRLGETCFIQQYVDHDQSPGISDYRCGLQSYDGHKGTDFRIPDLPTMRAGVDVLASASGRVLGVRDGEPDDFARDRNAADLEGKECGNGIVLEHGGGWQTQYCHLQKGSVRVQTGEQVVSGQTLGLVGLSGKADFPHVHLSLRYNGRVIDPFAFDGPKATCDGPNVPLWSDEADKVLGYRDASILNTGFNDGSIDNRMIEEGAGKVFQLKQNSPALVVFARMINPQEGDSLRLSIDGPGGIDLVSDADPAPRHQAQRMAFAGRKRPQGGWPKGEYQATVEIIRDGGVLERRNLSLRLD